MMVCRCEKGKCGMIIDGIDLSPVAEIIAEYGNVAGSLITMLQKIQAVYGYLPAAALSYLSSETGIRLAKIMGVASFYTQFRLQPVGKYLIMLCQGTACHVNGSKEVEAAIMEELQIKDGETTPDNVFTLNNVACLGCCSLAPVMMINGETYGRLTGAKAKEILREIRKKEEAEKTEKIKEGR